MTQRCIHALVSGKVQGVFYRDSTREKAQALQLTGWVKNLNNGTVEVMACGDPDNIQTFLHWLRQGPPRAKVTDVQWQEANPQNFSAFKIKF